jgi:hypothetical protein
MYASSTVPPFQTVPSFSKRSANSTFSIAIWKQNKNILAIAIIIWVTNASAIVRGKSLPIPSYMRSRILRERDFCIRYREGEYPTNLNCFRPSRLTSICSLAVHGTLLYKAVSCSTPRTNLASPFPSLRTSSYSLSFSSGCVACAVKVVVRLIQDASFGNR